MIQERIESERQPDEDTSSTTEEDSDDEQGGVRESVGTLRHMDPFIYDPDEPEDLPAWMGDKRVNGIVALRMFLP